MKNWTQISKVVGSKTVTIIDEADDGSIRVYVHRRAGSSDNYYMPSGFVRGSSELEYDMEGRS